MGAFWTKSGVTRTLLSSAAFAGLAGSPNMVFAETGWRITGSASESITLTEDRISSLTSFNISALTETERMRFGVNTGFGLAVSTGSGVNAVLPSLGVNYGIDSKRMTITTSASLQFTPVTFLADDELDLTTNEETGIRRSIGASARVNYDLTPRATGSLSYSFRGIDFTDDVASLVTSNTNNINASVSYNLADDTTIVASIGARWFDADNEQNSESFTLDSNVRVSYEATSRISVDAGAGITWARSEDDIVVLGVRQITETESTAFLINGGISYGLPDGTLRLGIAQRVSPEAGSGELTRFSNITLGYTHALNATTQLGLNVAWANQETIPTNISTNQFSINPSIRWDFSDDLTASVGYSYRVRDDSDSHRLTFLISKSLETGL